MKPGCLLTAVECSLVGGGGAAVRGDSCLWLHRRGVVMATCVADAKSGPDDGDAQ